MREIDVAARDIITAAFNRAIEILQGRRADLDQDVALLLAKEIVTAEDFPAIRPPETRASKAIELQP